MNENIKKISNKFEIILKSAQANTPTAKMKFGAFAQQYGFDELSKYLGVEPGQALVNRAKFEGQQLINFKKSELREKQMQWQRELIQLKSDILSFKKIVKSIKE